MSNGTVLATYSFLPWLRQGIANDIETNPGAGQRATINLTVELEGIDTATNTRKPAAAEVAAELVGPGDIIGLSADAIVRTEPRHWTTDHEPNYLCFTEFYDEDFPWRYSPIPSDSEKHRIIPWLTLVALKEDEFDDEPPLAGPLPTIETKVASETLFPPPEQLWAWAHVHVNTDLTRDPGSNPIGVGQSVERLKAILDRNSDLAYSRLLCPRKLDARIGYHAFLVPTFEAGRRAGLGEAIDPAVGVLEHAWGGAKTRFPYYYRWYFRTSERGDFEHLVRLLKPRETDRRVGIRDMDVSNPGAEIPGIDLGHDQPQVMGMEGALKSPSTESTDWPKAYPEPFQNQLTDEFINKAAQYHEANPDSDPVVAPPLYARWHTLRDRLSLSVDTGSNPYDPQAKWLTELNLDPRHRAAAGLGTRIVQDKQESLLDQAWGQVGEVLEANRRLRIAQLAEAGSTVLYDKHLRQLVESVQLALTAPVHKRVLDGAETVHRTVRTSKVPQAVLSPEFRRLTRPRGPISKRLLPPDQLKPQADLLTRINQGEITATPPKRVPSGAMLMDKVGHVIRPDRDLAPEVIEELRPISDFIVTEPEEDVEFEPGEEDSAEAKRFKEALRDLHGMFVDVPAPAIARPELDISGVASATANAIEPKVALKKRVLHGLLLPAAILARIPDRIIPVMAYPEFPQPMYEALRDLSSEFLVPNIDLVPRNTITLLITNQKFIESYMVGLNHELGRELLWREYPTDQRGSYFRQFWDVRSFVNTSDVLSEQMLAEKLKDVPKIHIWQSTTELGTHNHREFEGDVTQLVLVIRGDLLKRYPNAVIYAHRAEWKLDDQGNPLKLEPRSLTTASANSDGAPNQKYPLYSAKIEPDVYFVGFDLTVEEARGETETDPDDPGWFFVLEERPGEPRFGLDLEDRSVDVPLADWDDLSWADVRGDFASGNHIHLPSTPIVPDPAPGDGVEWSAQTNAADLAFILNQDPVRVAVHAQEMLGNLRQPNNS